VWRAEPPATDPGMRAVRLGLFASLIAVLVANVFYDYILRTFVWVIAGLAVCGARLVVRESTPRPVA